MAKAHAMVTAELLPIVHGIRQDASDEEHVRSTVKRLAKQFARDITPNKLKPLADQVAQRTSDFQKVQLQSQIKDVIGVTPLIRDEGLADAAAAFTKENVALIKTVPERYFSDVESTVVDGINSGARATTIAKDLEQRYQVSESNAARIANDQVGKFFGDLNDTRQQELGITQAVWTTVHDNRVRDSHQELDGQIYDLGDGLMDDQTGEKVIPGEAINCRCQGMPDLSGLLGS
jgi:SPP1 gp7 family putative phage head morphogenesis protein